MPLEQLVPVFFKKKGGANTGLDRLVALAYVSQSLIPTLEQLGCMDWKQEKKGQGIPPSLLLALSPPFAFLGPNHRYSHAQKKFASTCTSSRLSDQMGKGLKLSNTLWWWLVAGGSNY